MGARATLAVLLAAAGCASPAARQCNIHSDCKLGMYCSTAGTCRTECRADFDCGGGRCDTTIGRCVGAADGGAGDAAGARDLAASPAADLATMSGADLALAQDMAFSPDLVMITKSYGDVCQQNGECKSAICSSHPFAPGDRHCTGDCNAGCMIGDFCAGGLTCAQSDIGKSCVLNNMGQDCRGGACLGGNPAPSYCTRVCQSAADCPGGYTCSSVSNTRVCVNVDATQRCFSDADCWYSTRCDVARGRCLGDCRNDFDCPLWNVCTPLNGRLLCAPKLAQGRGGIDAPCAGPNDCRTGACLGNRCLGGCSVVANLGQWCPGGFGCNPIDDGQGGYTLGCLPAGLGSPGAPCKDNAGCASGLCIDNPGYCTRFCNAAPCPSVAPKCVAIGVVADGIALKACTK